MQKNTIINQVKMAQIGDNFAIPTKICYDGNKTFIGKDAEAYVSKEAKIYQNFKVELGKKTTQQMSNNPLKISATKKRSYLGMTKDFLTKVCDEIEVKLLNEGAEIARKALVAEPLSLETEEIKASTGWLANYRSGVRNALGGKFDSVDFLPEPFAVFQFYRYGFRHPLLSGQKRHTALVLDFGGGTFDVSVIDTTAKGDISYGGKNSRPLAAKSIAVGGFYINQIIAENLLFNALITKPDKTNARKFIKSILQIGSFQGEDVENLNLTEKEGNFFKHFSNLLEEVEGAKIRITNSILNWNLGANLTSAISHTITVPRQPFTESGDIIEIQFQAEQFRRIFVDDIWTQKLKSALISALNRAKLELEGTPISVVLLSGGSTNIKWITHLIKDDLSEYINDADLLEVNDNYQEIVAKGLAVESARKNYNDDGDGDFGAVTYNKINLGIRVNNGKIEWNKFSPRTEGLPTPIQGDEGVLLPSAHSLRAFIDKKMTWKVKLSGAPTSSLQYHYLKSSFDPQDTNNVYNLLDDKILTPKGWKAFGQAIDVELTVKQDGTAIPCFVYGKGNNYQRIEGKPFYLDMTYATKHASEGTFLGIDFGTATTAASIVSEKDVRAYQERAEDKNWLEISDMVDTLPYCISQNLARYISETDRAMLDRYGKNTLESMLSFVAYLCFADISVTKPEKLVNRISSQPPFKRSAGPLLNLIRSMKNLNLEGTFLAKRMLAPLDESVISKIEHATKQLNDSKHGGDIYTDYNSLLKSLGNSINKAMSGFVFGRFEATKKQSFGGSYDGIFRVLSGKNQPFVSALTYKGYQDFAEHEIYIVDQHDKSCICISPFFIWGLDGLATGNASEELFSFDKFDRNSIKFNPTGVGPSISSGEHEHLEELWKYIENYFAGGIEYKIIKKVTLTERKN